MFEPLRIAFFAMGILIIMGGAIYFASAATLPGGFGGIIQGIVALYWFIILGFTLLIFMRTFIMVIDTIKNAGKRTHKQ